MRSSRALWDPSPPPPRPVRAPRTPPSRSCSARSRTSWSNSIRGRPPRTWPRCCPIPALHGAVVAGCRARRGRGDRPRRPPRVSRTRPRGDRGCSVGRASAAPGRRQADRLVAEALRPARDRRGLTAQPSRGCPRRRAPARPRAGDRGRRPPADAAILTRDWKHELRRGAQDTRIYASTFESLRDRGFPVVGLDQSFRLHAMTAAFLDEQVYGGSRSGSTPNERICSPHVTGSRSTCGPRSIPRFRW